MCQNIVVDNTSTSVLSTTVDLDKLRRFLFLGVAGFAFGFADEAHGAVERAVVAEVGIAGDALADFYALNSPRYKGGEADVSSVGVVIARFAVWATGPAFCCRYLLEGEPPRQPLTTFTHYCNH